jgi:outer membrane protein assembly factor BamB
MHVLVRAVVVTVMVAGLFAPRTTRGDDWPQWMGPQRDDVWRETGIIDRFPQGGPKVLWRYKIHGGYSGPAVANGLVYVMDYQTDGDVAARSNPRRPAGALKGKERVLCLDVKKGTKVWEHVCDCPYTVSYPAGPRCTPTVADGKVYALGTEGNLFCLDAKQGDVLWSKDFKKDYGAKTPMWGFCGHPLVLGQKLICIVGGKGSLAVAFDRQTGKELWKSLDAEEPGYSAPVLIEAGGKKQVVIWSAETINGLDPNTGKPYWSVDLKPSFGMSIMVPRQAGTLLFAGGIVGQCACLELAGDRPAAKVLWRGKRDTGVYPVNMTPFIEAGTIYAVDQPGQLRAVDLKSGKRLWETFKPVRGEQVNAGTAFLTRNGDRFFVFNELGELIIARLSRTGYEEIDRWKMLAPAGTTFGRSVVWSHPAFADKCVFARNDREIVCASLAK